MGSTPEYTQHVFAEKVENILCSHSLSGAILLGTFNLYFCDKIVQKFLLIWGYACDHNFW